MKRRCIPSLSARSVSAGLILTLVSCSGPQSHSNVYCSAETRHPNLSLYPGKVSHNLLISDAELRGAKIGRGKQEHLSFGKTMYAAILVTAGVTMVAGAIMSSPYGGMQSDLPWPTNIPDIHENPTPFHRTLLRTKDAELKLSGMEIRYLPSKAGHGIGLARAVGQARMEVSDAFGSYYCRADEIHYRAATNEIILRGRVSVSSTYAPDIHDFGLTRIDLARCALEYTSKGQKQPSLSKHDSEGLVAVQRKFLYP